MALTEGYSAAFIGAAATAALGALAAAVLLRRPVTQEVDPVSEHAG